MPTGRLLDNRVEELLGAGKTDEALETAEAALVSARRLARSEESSSMIPLMETQLLVADLYFKSGVKDLAERRYKDVMDQVQAEGLPRELMARAVAALAAIAEERGFHHQAVKGYEEAIKIWESAAPLEVEVVAHLRNNLGMIYKDEGDYESAEDHFVTGAERLEGQIGRYNETVAAIYNNLAALYHAVGHLDHARELAVKALDIRQQILPPDHPDTAQSFSNLGSISYALDDFDAAVDCFSRAVEILEKVAGADPQEYEVVVSNYIDLLNHVGESEKAGEITRNARRVYAKLMGS